MNNEKMNTLISKYTARYKKYQLVVVITAFFQFLTNVGVALSLKLIVDTALQYKNISHLIIFCSLYLLCALSNVFFSVKKQKNASTIGERALADLRNDIFAHYLKLSLRDQDKIKSGDILTLCMQDTAAFKEILATQFVRKITNGIAIPVLIASMLFMNWMLTLLVIMGLPFFLLSVTLFGKKLQSTERKAMESQQALNQMIMQSVGGIEVIRHLNATRQLEEKLYERVQSFQKAVRSKQCVVSLKRVSETFLSNFFVALFLVIGGYLFLMYSCGSPGIILSFIMLIPILYQSAVDIISLYLEKTKSLVNLERINQILDYPVEQSGELNTLAANIEIKVKNVYFYHKEREILHNINLHIRPGEKIAIVGKSGSGKTTLTYLLAGLYHPDKGTVLYGNQPISTYTEKSRYKMVGLMEQTSFFFDDNIQNSIYGSEKPDKERMYAAARQAKIHDEILNTANGYETELGEKTTLSGGQKQRLALARLLFRQPQIYILDEPTSALDEQAQDDFYQIVNNELSHATVIFVTHNLNLARKAERIIHVENGRIVYDGDAKGLQWEEVRNLEYI